MTDEIPDRVEGLLARLVEQFSSPYDFLRELVQNAMDGGSDVVDVRLVTHPGDTDEEVVFELAVVDSGRGMNDAIIDNELTRLFASSKRGDRTMAGGYGIGFVSVFAWEPQTVLLQTGRNDESWELVFDAQRRFEKHALDAPFEGTSVRLFRTGRPDERTAIADAVRDALWRWCRYVPIEVTFEDEAGGEGPERIEDAPIPEDALLQAVESDGTTHIRVAFAIPPHAVLLRHGLVLAEGAPAAHLVHVAPKLGSTLEHLRVWADSPRLRTSLARDKVLDDDPESSRGRAEVEQDLERLVERLRDELVQRLETLASARDHWGERAHDEYAYLHAHLQLEMHARGKDALSRVLLRSPAGTAVSVAGLEARARAGLVAVVEPDEGAPEVEAARAGLRVVAGQCGLPMLVARWPQDRGWLEPMLARRALTVLPLRRAVSRITPIEGVAEGLASAVTRLLQQRDDGLGAIGFAHFVDAESGHPPPVGVQGASGAALIGGPLRPAWVRGRALWLDPEHPVVARAMAQFARRPAFAAYAVAVAVGAALGDPSLGAERLTEAVAAMG